MDEIICHLKVPVEPPLLLELGDLAWELGAGEVFFCSPGDALDTLPMNEPHFTGLYCQTDVSMEESDSLGLPSLLSPVGKARR